jgi:multidrug resistance efflux pump
MKKAIIILFVIVLLAGAAFIYTQRNSITIGKLMGGQPTSEAVLAANTTEVDGIEPVRTSNEINIQGRVVPAQQSELRFITSGSIKEILVEEGQQVKNGDILARLKDETQMTLAVSEARLEVMNAEKVLSDLEENAPLLAAQNNYDATQLEEELEKAEKKRNSMEYPRASDKDISDAYKDYTEADRIYKEVEEYATSSNKNLRDMYKQALDARTQTLARYNWYIGKYTDLEKREAEADIQLLQAKIETFKRQYEIYSKGPDPQEVAIAEARLDVARARLAAAEGEFEKLVLRAPFSGVIARLDFEAGQTVIAGQPVLLLADLTRWHVETEDLTELSVPRIQEGAEATVRFDALPDAAFKGTVIEIKNIGETRRGDITYTAVISLDKNDPRLRWNMTSPITISTKEQ